LRGLLRIAKRIERGRRKRLLIAPLLSELTGALDALRDAEQAAQEAAKALREGDADKGLKKQREAQQKLEMAREALGDGEGERDAPGSEGDRRPRNDHAEIPKADAHKGPEEFRKRVIKGLGQPSGGKYTEAVKRYAEGLLR
ncbi:MAG TPA: hypothetical protein VM925_24935, partial [Labilithrix sp.]|nr:hypothetical protein [Labilithrix sp.]